MEPRKLLNVIGQPVEMKRSGKQTFCCGAGGAHMWMEERGTQINVERAREAAETGAETLAVACPFCIVMFDDGMRETGAELRVADVATLLRGEPGHGRIDCAAYLLDGGGISPPAIGGVHGRPSHELRSADRSHRRVAVRRHVRVLDFGLLL